MARVRRGFTLVELLVATGVFALGFTAVFTLFLKGMWFRQQADNLTKASLAASSLLDEFRLDTGLDANGGMPREPREYIGTGFAPMPAPGTLGSAERLYLYTAMPGIWYCVRSCTDLLGKDDNSLSTTLHFELVVVPVSISESVAHDNADPNKAGFNMTESWFRRRMSIPPGSTSDQIIANLVDRGLAFRFRGAVVRRASWLPTR